MTHSTTLSQSPSPSSSKETLSDNQLVALCKKELPTTLTAYKQLVERYEGMVYSLCLQFLNSPEDAEEIAQDSLLQVFHKIHQFEGRSSFKTWLYKIVHNFCKNRISKLARKRELKESYKEKGIDNSPACVFTDNLQSEKKALIQEALNKLKDGEKEILLHRFVSGLTLQEIAQVLEIGDSAAKMRYYRALDSFKAVYQKLSTD